MEQFAPIQSPGNDAGDNFQEQLQQSLRRAPWMAISIAFHAVLFLVLNNMIWSTSTSQESRAIQAELETEDVEVIPEEPIHHEKEDPVDPEEIDDPEITEEQVDSQLEPVDDPRAPIDSNLMNRATNDILGAGGGGGGDGPAGRRRGGGGGAKAAEAVTDGLDWLHRHQESDGFWDCDDFNRNSTSPLNDGRGNAMHDVGVTGLALLAFLGAGHTSESGKYRDDVKKGLRWLITQQDREDGCFGAKSSPQFVYGHALATLAMVEAYHLSGAPLLRRPAQQGVHFIHRARTPYSGWRYDYPPEGRADVSITGWMLFALHAAEEAGLDTDKSAISDGMAFIHKMTDSIGRTGYKETGTTPARDGDNKDHWPAEYSESMTAVGCLCRIFDGEEPENSEQLRMGADLLKRKLPRWDEAKGCIDFYYWYYGSYVMWQMGGRHWKQWQTAMLPSIIDHQLDSDGDEQGSWNPQVDPWGKDGGRVYSTAINILCLEVYYRYDHIMGSR